MTCDNLILGAFGLGNHNGSIPNPKDNYREIDKMECFIHHEFEDESHYKYFCISKLVIDNIINIIFYCLCNRVIDYIYLK